MGYRSLDNPYVVALLRLAGCWALGVHLLDCRGYEIALFLAKWLGKKSDNAAE